MSGWEESMSMRATNRLNVEPCGLRLCASSCVLCFLPLVDSCGETSSTTACYVPCSPTRIIGLSISSRAWLACPSTAEARAGAPFGPMRRACHGHTIVTAASCWRLERSSAVNTASLQPTALDIIHSLTTSY